jgi:hypothetical protein
LISSINKNDRYKITEILLKMELKFKNTKITMMEAGGKTQRYQ